MSLNATAELIYQDYLDGMSVDDLKTKYKVKNPETLIKIMHYASVELRHIIIDRIGMIPAYDIVKVKNSDHQHHLFNLVNGVKGNKSMIIKDEISRQNFPIYRLSLPIVNTRRHTPETSYENTLDTITINVLNLIESQISGTDLTFEDVYSRLPELAKKCNLHIID